MEVDYTQELIEKWSAMGHLEGVEPQDRVIVAARLEAAHRRTLGQRGDPNALHRELQRLRAEGLIGDLPVEPPFAGRKRRRHTP